MEQKTELIKLRQRVKDNLEGCIMPFWKDHMLDDLQGGFYGKVTGDLKPDRTSPKAVVLNTRMLWYYTRIYDLYGGETYLFLAKRSFDYILEHFYDKTYGGAYWLVNARGDPLEIEKRTYGQAFLIFCMAEYYRVFRNQTALDVAMETFDLLERHVRREKGGYYDAVSRDWTVDPFLRRWAMNASGDPIVLNSQMHLLEAYTALLHVHEDPVLRSALRDFLDYFLNKAYDAQSGHFKAGMDDDSQRTDQDISFGHDSECCYLITDCAALIGDTHLAAKAEEVVRTVMPQVHEKGIDWVNGGIFYEAYLDTESINKCKVWWTQAESLTGMMNAYQVTGDPKYLTAVLNIWNYVENEMVDKENGEWLALGENRIISEEDRRLEQVIKGRVGDPYVKASRTKCPYHNGKACLELIARIDALLRENAL